MLSLPKLNKGVPGATSSLMRVRRVVAAASLGVGLLSAEPHRAAAPSAAVFVRTAESMDAKSLALGRGALLLTRHHQNPLLAGHASHFSHISHVSHASGNSLPEPKPETSDGAGGAAHASKDEQLRHLTALLDAGVLTPEEFEILKKKVLEKR